MNRAEPFNRHFDLLIVGAGMVGMTLAAALRQTSLKVGLIEAQSLEEKMAHEDGRASALALGSVQFFDQIGVWLSMQTLGVSPIHQVQISDEGFPLTTTLTREAMQVDALGYVVENWVTERALQKQLQEAPGMSWFRPARVKTLSTQADCVNLTLDQAGHTRQLSAQLVVGADGRQSFIRQQAQIPVRGWGYDQVLIVCTITTEFPHRQIGFERFHRSGPFGILPMVSPPEASDVSRCCIVWTAKAPERDELMALDDAAFMAALSPRLSPKLGRVLSVSPRYCYWPRRQQAQDYFCDRIVLVGDAAHATHPVGGQGFNLGVRDTATLAALIIQAHSQGRDLGDAALLRQYQRQRQLDSELTLFGTDLANRLFSNSWLPLQWLRRLGLLGLEQMLPLKQLLMQRAMGIVSSSGVGS